MVVHLAAFSESSAKNGLTAMTPCAPDALEPIANYTGDDFRLNRDTNLLGAVLVSEAEANAVSWRIKKATEANWRNFNLGIRQDDADLEPDQVALVGSMQVPFKVNDVLNGQADNGNNAQLETIGLWFGNPGDISPVPVPCTEVVEGQATGTLTVDIWTDVGAITWSHSFEADRLYQIVGLAMWSATGHLGRLNLTANNILAKPGVIAGTTVLAGNHILWGNLGSFKGSNPPGAEMLANTADTAETITMFLR